MKAILFVRVSTMDQDYERQIDDLTAIAVKKGWTITGTIAEKVSGALPNSKRMAVKELLERAQRKEFDLVMVTEGSRLGRDSHQMSKLINELTDLKVGVYFQNWDLITIDENGQRDPTKDLHLSIINYTSAMERKYLIERIRSGMTKARSKGVHVGRPAGIKLDAAGLVKKYPAAVRDLKKGISIRKVAKLHGLSPGTVMTLKKACNL